MSIPQMAPELIKNIDQQFPGFQNWYTLLMTFLKTKFDTQGDIRFLVAAKGIFIISPNGTKYKATVDNTGAWLIAPE